MKLDFDKLQGLVPTVVQDFASGEVLMLGYMNPAALKATLATCCVCASCVWTATPTPGWRGWKRSAPASATRATAVASTAGWNPPALRR